MIGHGNDSDRRVYRRKWVIRDQDALARERVEERGLPHIGQPHDADGKRHDGA